VAVKHQSSSFTYVIIKSVNHSFSQLASHNAKVTNRILTKLLSVVNIARNPVQLQYVPMRVKSFKKIINSNNSSANDFTSNRFSNIMNTNTQKYYKVKDKLRTAYIIAVETNAVTSGMIKMSDAVTSHSLHARTHARTRIHCLSLMTMNLLED